MKINCPQKTGIIQAPLQALNAKLQKTKISTVYGVCVCSRLRTRMSCLNYKVAMIGKVVLQPGFKPRTVANPALNSGCAMLII